MLVSELIDLYLRHAVAVGLFCPDALAQRRQTLGLFQEALGSRLIADCRAFHLSDWIEGHPSWRSTATRKARANQVNACFNWAARQKRIAENPFAGVSYAEAEPRPCLPDESLHQLEKLAPKPFERALRFLRLTGCRLSDLCRMTWADVDLARGLVLLQRHKSKKRTGKPKVIVLVAEAVKLLGELEGARTGAVLVNSRGTAWTRRTLGQQLLRMKKRYGLELAATLHGIRHTFGSEGVKNGASLKLLSLQLGHASTAITERYYVHVEREVEAIRQAAEKAARSG